MTTKHKVVSNVVFAPDCADCLHNMLNHTELKGGCEVKNCICKRVQASYIGYKKWYRETTHSKEKSA